MEWCRSKLGIQRSFEGEQAVRFIPGEELSYINLIAREDKGDREGIPHIHPIPQAIRLELFLESG